MSNDISKNENTVRFFVTGDNHFCRTYDKSPLKQVSTELEEYRFDSLQAMVDEANRQDCDFFIVTGDLFDRTKNIPTDAIKRIVRILGSFNKMVFVIPGNHDYYDKYSVSMSVWKTFLDQAADNVVVLREFRTVPAGNVGNNKVVFYPAFCDQYQARYMENNLGWIKKSKINEENTINIGIAHGTLEDLSADDKREYFYMTRDELASIPMDAWFLGHAHVPEPKVLSEDEFSEGHRIFNPGTNQQLDIRDQGGYGFIVEVEKNGKDSVIRAKKWRSSKIEFHEFDIDVVADSDHALKDEISKKLSGFDQDRRSRSVIRMDIKGSVEASEYEAKDDIYDEETKGFMFAYQPVWDKLFEEVTKEKIDEFNSEGFAYQFLNSIAGNDPDKNVKLNLAYQMIRQIQNEQSSSRGKK